MSRPARSRGSSRRSSRDRAPRSAGRAPRAARRRARAPGRAARARTCRRTLRPRRARSAQQLHLEPSEPPIPDLLDSLTLPWLGVHGRRFGYYTFAVSREWWGFIFLMVVMKVPNPYLAGVVWY